MLRFCKYFYTLVCLYSLIVAAYAYAEDDPKDLIDIFESNSRITAVIPGGHL